MLGGTGCKKSGASITAEFALEQGRMVFAVPGSVFHELHQGCHALIKEGATLIGSAHELLAELGEINLQAKEQQQSIAVLTQQPIRQSLPANASIEQQILYHCSLNALSIDELIRHTELSLDEMHDHLFNLQLAGKIEQNAVGLWLSVPV